MIRVAFVVQLPEKISPGQRFRIEQFHRYLSDRGIRYDTFPFFDHATRRILYRKGFFFQKTLGVVKGFFKRIAFLFQAGRYDYIFLQREAMPIGPPVIEWFLARVLRKKIIYDYDDAIWIPNSTADSRMIAWLKSFWKIRHICAWSYKVVGGNDYLCDYGRRYNKNVIRIPTTVDMSIGHNQVKFHHNGPVIIGWTGSHSTLKYLDDIIPVLRKLREKKEFELLVIADIAPSFEFPNLRFVPWNAKTEVDDLLKMDIGIMPLTPDEWSEGKCGFKLIQYLSLGIPAVASPVGVNKIIIEQGVNGFLCTTDEQWIEALETLIGDLPLRQRMADAGREKILREFNTEVHAEAFVKLFS